MRERNVASMATIKNKEPWKEGKAPFCWTLPLELSTRLKNSGHMLLNGWKFIVSHMKSEHKGQRSAKKKFKQCFEKLIWNLSPVRGTRRTFTECTCIVKWWLTRIAI